MTASGRLVVFEGPDGCGKTTQVAAVAARLEALGRRVHRASFPHYGNPHTGIVISEFLRGDYGGVAAVHPRLVALAFAVDRYTRRDELVAALAANDFVLVDRYTYSNVAFQTAKLVEPEHKPAFRDWVMGLDFDLFRMPVPDDVLVFLAGLDAMRAINDARTRMTPRDYVGDARDIHEASAALQAEVVAEYEAMAARHPAFHVVRPTQGATWRPRAEITDEIVGRLLRREA